MSRLISIRRLYLILFQCFLTVFLVHCSSSEIEDQQAVEQMDVFKVSDTHLSKFLEKYEAFVSDLSEKHREQLQVFLAEKDESNNGSRTATVTCDCPGQSSCSCSTWLSECCICWSATTHEGACGSYGGFCSCRTGPKENPSLGRTVVENFVTIKALNFRETIRFLESKGIDTKLLKTAFFELEKEALPLENELRN